MKYIGNVQSQANAEVFAVASGALPDGKPVIVNSNGTVSVVSQTSITEATGSGVVFQSNQTDSFKGAFDSTNNRVLFVYRDYANSQYGKVVAGTISGTSISFGTPVVFRSGETTYPDIDFSPDRGRFMIAYRSGSQGDDGYVTTGYISNTSTNAITIPSGGSSEFSNNGNTESTSIAYDGPDGSGGSYFMVAYRDDSDSGKAKLALIQYPSNSDTPSVISRTDVNSNSVFISIAASKVSGVGVICYRFSGDYVYARVYTRSGTSVSIGSQQIAYNSAATNDPRLGYDPVNDKYVFVWNLDSGAGSGMAVVGTVSGSTMSFGSAATFASASTEYQNPVYHAASGNMLVAFRDVGDSNKGMIVSGTISGTSISFGSETNVISRTGGNTSALVSDTSSNNVALGWTDGQNSDHGTGIVYRPSYSSTNLTTENFLGFTGGEVVSESASQALGSEATFTPSDINASYIASAFDSNTGKVATVYRAGNGYAYVVVGTVSGTNITFGTPVAMASESSSVFAITFDSNANKIVVFQRQDDNGSQARAYVGTISGTSVSFGSAVVAHGASTNYLRAIFDSNSNKVVFVYQDDGNSDYGTAVVGTVSGTSISFGTAVVFESASTLFIGASFDSTVNKVVIVYRDGGNSNYGTAIVGTVSGTDISFGSPAIYHTGGAAWYNNCVYDSDQNKTVIVFGDGGDSNKGKACVGTISGTNISFGSVATFDAASSISHAYYSPVYDTEAKRIVVSYSTSANLELVVGTVSETSISFETAVVLDTSNSVTYVAATFDSTNNKVITSWRDPDADGAGKSIVLQTGYVNTTRGEIADGKTATIQVGGAINTKQLSLTAGQQYFVQGDGTIGTTAASPSVIAGTAVSATDLIVKG